MDFSFRFVGNSDKTLNKVGGEFDQFGWEVVTLEGGGGGGGASPTPPPPPSSPQMKPCSIPNIET